MKQNKVNDESGVKIAKRRAVSSNRLSLKSSLDKEKSSKVVKKKIFTKKPASKQAPKFWFDGVEPELLGDKTDSSDSVFVKSRSFSGMTKAIAMDCEMVGVGELGQVSVLARISLVNLFGHCIYDKHVKPREEVTDYRTSVSGIRPSDLENAEEFDVVQKEVSEILKGRILVGHSVWHDMEVLFLDHPNKDIRDTARYEPFRSLANGRSPALRVLCEKILGVQIQKGEHSSVTDAQATMRLYTMHQKEWEQSIKFKRSSNFVVKYKRFIYHPINLESGFE